MKKLDLFENKTECCLCGSLEGDDEMVIEIHDRKSDSGGLNVYDVLCRSCYGYVLNGIDQLIESRKKLKQCKHTKTDKRYRADENTGEVKKIGIYCADCGKWIKWESFVDDADFVMPFGKFKGQKIVDIVKNERDYSLYAINNILKGSLKARFVRLYDGK